MEDFNNTENSSVIQFQISVCSDVFAVIQVDPGVDGLWESFQIIYLHSGLFLFLEIIVIVLEQSVSDVRTPPHDFVVGLHS